MKSWGAKEKLQAPNLEEVQQKLSDHDPLLLTLCKRVVPAQASNLKG